MVNDIKNVSTFDTVNHPFHYAGQGSVECIDFIKVLIAPYQGVIAGDLQNVLKYTYRAHYKNGIEDIKKARWYAGHAVREIYRQQNDTELIARAWRTAFVKRTTEEQILFEKACKEIEERLAEQEVSCFREMVHAIDSANLYQFKKGPVWLLNALDEWITIYPGAEGGNCG